MARKAIFKSNLVEFQPIYQTTKRFYGNKTVRSGEIIFYFKTSQDKGWILQRKWNCRLN